MSIDTKELIEAISRTVPATPLPLVPKVYVHISEIFNRNQRQAILIKELELQNRQLAERLCIQEEETIKNQQLAARDREGYLQIIQTQERDLHLNCTNLSLAQQQLLQRDEELKKCNETIAALMREKEALKEDLAFKDDIIEQLSADLDCHRSDAKEKAELSEDGIGLHAASILQNLEGKAEDEEEAEDAGTYLFRGPGAVNSRNSSSISTAISAPSTNPRQGPQ